MCVRAYQNVPEVLQTSVSIFSYQDFMNHLSEWDREAEDSLASKCPLIISSNFFSSWPLSVTNGEMDGKEPLPPSTYRLFAELLLNADPGGNVEEQKYMKVHGGNEPKKWSWR